MMNFILLQAQNLQVCYVAETLGLASLGCSYDNLFHFCKILIQNMLGLSVTNLIYKVTDFDTTTDHMIYCYIKQGKLLHIHT